MFAKKAWGSHNADKHGTIAADDFEPDPRQEAQPIKWGRWH